MDRFGRAVERARQPSEREWAALFVLGGAAVFLSGLGDAMISPSTARGSLLRYVQMGLLLFAIGHLPRLRLRLVAQLEGRRPPGGVELEPLSMRTIAAMALSVASFAPWWWVRVVSWIAMTVVTRSPFYALFAAGASALYDRVPAGISEACMGLACIADGCFRWGRAGRAQLPEPVNENLAGDLLALIETVGPVDARWLERSSGLDTPERVTACLLEIRGRGLLIETGRGVCDVNRDAQKPGHGIPTV